MSETPEIPAAQPNVLVLNNVHLPFVLGQAAVNIAQANGVDISIILSAALELLMAGFQVNGKIAAARQAIVIPQPGLRIARNNGNGEI